MIAEPKVDVYPSDQPVPTPILIADDSPVSRKILEASLKKWGFQVSSVTNGSEAWAVLQREDAPRMAILDWMMPGLSGPEVCAMVRQQRKRYYTYIILLTSRHEKEDLIAGMQAGADDYLIKPFDNNELKVRLTPGQRIVELQAKLLEAQELLREQATRDSLTRLWNRHAIFDILSRELARNQRDKSPLGIAMTDIDKFKSINDTHGHQAGDAVLREVANRLQGSIRAYDAVGRYGGEEFLVILPKCDPDQTIIAAERMRESIRASEIVIGERSLSVTASFGVTSLPGGIATGPERLIKLADEALYQAKAQGRNRTVRSDYS
jgi:diguanylate cyclase (GGDEF)-like protein